jgi:hypothetical protein
MKRYGIIYELGVAVDREEEKGTEDQVSWLALTPTI